MTWAAQNFIYAPLTCWQHPQPYLHSEYHLFRIAKRKQLSYHRNEKAPHFCEAFVPRTVESLPDCVTQAGLPDCSRRRGTRDSSFSIQIFQQPYFSGRSF